MTMTENKKGYTTEWQLATYLEAEWSDFLLGNTLPDSEQKLFDPRITHIYPNFYRRIGELAQEWLQKNHSVPVKYLDVGGSTGRTLYEIYNSFPSLAELVLVEPSSKFCKLAQQILIDSEELGYFPIVGNCDQPSYGKAVNRPDPIRLKEVYIYEAFAESVPRPANYFDLITCLNVADRHPNPKTLVQTLYDLLSPNGYLIFASPMDFNEIYTPDKERWVSNLNILFPNELWKSIGDNDVFYDFRLHCRKWIRFSSQVVAKQKR